jgi:hypothetical protein
MQGGGGIITEQSEFMEACVTVTESLKSWVRTKDINDQVSRLTHWGNSWLDKPLNMDPIVT